MEALTLGLLMLAAVLASSLIDQIIPKVSLPLVQIALGLLIAVVAGSEIEISLDPELFLVLFIAPLLYDEAKGADKVALWRERKPVLSLAIGLVVATALVIGFSLHAIVPSIPLAAAFALGAALGPTDAVAVSSLARQVNIPKRQASMLKGELLLNDASGIVSFQFAVGAVTTGTFSLLHASEDFLIEFVGGLIFGVIMGAVGNWVVRRARSIGVENTNFHVLFEVLIPFLIYLISSACHVSGVIAVVVAGLINVTSPRGEIGPSVSRMNIVSSSVWHVLTYALNGIVFVMLGTQLPNAMHDTWDNVAIQNSSLILLVLGLTALLLGTRFVWVMVMDFIHVKRAEKRKFKGSDVRSAAITTFAGAKGTITLSIMFSIQPFIAQRPYAVPFPQRDLLIFLACGVIVCTLLLATFVVPLLAPARDRGDDELKRAQRDADTSLDIMRRVIEMLTAQQTRDNRAETQAVIRSYNDRVVRIKENNDIADETNVELRLKALGWEYERTEELMERDLVNEDIGDRYLDRLDRTMELLEHGKRHEGYLRRKTHRLRSLLHRGLRTLLRELPGAPGMAEQAKEMRWLQIMARTYAMEHLEEAVTSSRVPTEDAAALLTEYQRAVTDLHNARPSVEAVIKAGDRIEDIMRKAYDYEIEQIQEAYEEDRLTRVYANRMRENVQLMQMDLEDAL